MSEMASQITSVTIVYSTVYSGTDQIKHQSSASPAFVREFTGDCVNSPHKGPVTRKMFPFGDDILEPYLNVFSVIWNMYIERILEREKEDIEFAIF